MELKDKIEILNNQIDSLNKEADIIYKKVFLLFLINTGISGLLFKFESYLFLFLLVAFIIIGIAIFRGYYRLGILKDESKEINLKIKRIINE
jgi:hypothetical protein